MYLTMTDIPQDVDIEKLFKSFDIALLIVGIDPNECEMNLGVERNV